MTAVLTPRISRASDERRDITISDKDYEAIGIHAGRRHPGWKHFVTDLESGELVLIEGTPCSLPHCFCDAVIVDSSETH